MNDSITKAINDWLLEFDEIKNNLDLDIEELESGYKKLALQRSGVVNLKNYNGGTQQNQYQYMLFLKETSENNEEIIRNFDWLDSLTIKVREKSNKNDLPKINNKIFNSALCINPITYQVSENGSITNYAVQIYFNINE